MRKSGLIHWGKVACCTVAATCLFALPAASQEAVADELAVSTAEAPGGVPEEGERNRMIDVPPAREPRSEAIPADKRWYHLPLPLIGTESLPPQVPGQLVEPMSNKQKVLYYVDKTVGPEALLNRAVLAGMNQYRNKPDEWGQGWDAYGKRYGYRMTRLAVRNAVMLGFDVAMKTDQRYDRCACTGVLGRTAHAFRRVVIARTDNGGETLNLARIAGAYAGSAVAYQLYPAQYRGAQQIMSGGSEYLLFRGVSNLVREFWPEIHRVVKIGPRPRR